MPDDPSGMGPTEQLARDLDATRRVSPPGPDMPTVIGGAPVQAKANDAPTQIGPYEVRAELGRGGMGVVYRAFDPGLRREVALKVLHISGRVGFEAIERFHREARAAAKLSHPGIVQIHDVGEAAGMPYYTMELLAGRGLDDTLRDPGIAARETVDLVRQVALALQYAHERGVLHRDVKPRNIVVAREASGWIAKVVDFGLAKLVEQDLRVGAQGDESAPTLTRTGQVLGTPVYMSPEQVRGDRAIDARSDVYSLGVTLYEALAGRVPFDRATLAELFQAIATEDPTSLRSLNASIDPDLTTICMKCLQKEPRHRYATAGELAEDCRRWLQGEPIAARPVGALVRLWRRAKRNRRVAVPMAGMTLLLAVVLGAWVGGAIRDRMQLRGHLATAERMLATADGALAATRLEQALGEARQAARIDSEDTRVKGLLADIVAAQGMLIKSEYEAQDRKGKELRSAQRPEVRETRWLYDAEVERTESTRGAAWSRAVLKFHEALAHDPNHVSARSALAELYWDELIRAEQARDAAGIGRYRPLVERYGDVAMHQRLRGEQEVRVDFLLPEGFAADVVEAFLYRYERVTDPPVLAPAPYDPARKTSLGTPTLREWRPDPPTGRPGGFRMQSAFPTLGVDGNRLRLPVARQERPCARFQATLPRGSYLLFMPAGQGLFETRYPFVVERDTQWIECCELVAEGDAPPVPPGITAKGADPSAVSRFFWAYVPSGWTRLGGDPDALRIHGRPEEWRRIPQDGTRGFFIARLEFLAGAYTHYLSDRTWHEPRKAMRRVPRTATDIEQGEPYITLEDTGRFGFATSGWGPLWAVVGVSIDDAQDLCRWMTQKHGGGEWEFGLPSEDEWEMAARGADGRYFPWGDLFDSAFCRMAASRPEDQSGEAVGHFPVDESPYSVLELAGGVRERTSTPQPAHEGMSFVKGGSWQSIEVLCRPALHNGVQGAHVADEIGFRLVARRKK